MRADAAIATYALDPSLTANPPTGSLLGDMLNALGRAVSATIRRLGLHPAPWQLATVITAAGILAARPTPRSQRSS